MFFIFILMAGVVYAQDMSLLRPTRYPDCPIVDDNLHPVMLPNPNDCTKYYFCRNGYAYSYSCPGNFHWSQLSYRCDYPEVAQCSEPIPIPQPSPPIGNIPIYSADPNDCSQYYRYEKIRCPPNMFWSERLQRCDQPYLSECRSNYPPMAPTVIVPTPSTSPAIIENPIEMLPPPTSALNQLDELCSKYMGEVYINYPGDCHKFIQCNGVAYVNICPGNLFWNSMLKTCDRYCV